MAKEIFILPTYGCIDPLNLISGTLDWILYSSPVTQIYITHNISVYLNCRANSCRIDEIKYLNV